MSGHEEECPVINMNQFHGIPLRHRNPGFRSSDQTGPRGGQAAEAILTPPQFVEELVDRVLEADVRRNTIVTDRYLLQEAGRLLSSAFVLGSARQAGGSLPPSYSASPDRPNSRSVVLVYLARRPAASRAVRGVGQKAFHGTGRFDGWSRI